MRFSRPARPRTPVGSTSRASTAWPACSTPCDKGQGHTLYLALPPLPESILAGLLLSERAARVEPLALFSGACPPQRHWLCTMLEIEDIESGRVLVFGWLARLLGPPVEMDGACRLQVACSWSTHACCVIVRFIKLHPMMLMTI